MAGTMIDHSFIKGFAKNYKGGSCLFNCFFQNASIQYTQIQHIIFILAVICSLIITILPDLSTVRVVNDYV
jgi:hypothetical protein